MRIILIVELTEAQLERLGLAAVGRALAAEDRVETGLWNAVAAGVSEAESAIAQHLATVAARKRPCSRCQRVVVHSSCGLQQAPYHLRPHRKACEHHGCRECREAKGRQS